MTSMMNMTRMTSMKCMKWMVHVHTYIECKYYVIVYFFLPYIIIIPRYSPTEGYCNDSAVIAT